MDDLVLFQLFGFLPVSVVAVLDILVVALVVYRLLNLIRGMRAAQMLVGLFLLASVALAALLDLSMSVGWQVSLGLILGVAAQLGDLTESLLKRKAGVKDAGALLPGHGGLLDRMDSLVVTLPVTYYLISLIID